MNRREDSNEEELKFAYTLELAEYFLYKIEAIITKNKDTFGYPAIIVSLSDKEYRGFNLLYLLLKKIYENNKMNLVCSQHINYFNKIADDLPLIST